MLMALASCPRPIKTAPHARAHARGSLGSIGPLPHHSASASLHSICNPCDEENHIFIFCLYRRVWRFGDCQ